jgi:hypothetical protein
VVRTSRGAALAAPWRLSYGLAWGGCNLWGGQKV